jgi:hypothetical protein
MMEHDRQHRNVIVFVASEAVLAAWSRQPHSPGDVIGVSDADPRRALDAVRQWHPKMVVLEETFASTQQGAGFVRQLQSDPTVRPIHIRLLSPERVAYICRFGTARSLAALTHPMPSPRIERRYARWKVTTAVKTEMDGHAVTLVDVSTNGAQLLSPAAIRPTQRARVLIEDSVWIDAKVAWIAFEIRGAAPPRYRAGIEFVNPDYHQLHALFLRLGLPIAAPART